MKNEKMKLFINIFLIIVMLGTSLLVLTGCEDKKEENNNSTEENTVAQTPAAEPEEPVTLLEFPEASEADREILERYSNNNDYKVISVSGSKFEGYLIAIYEPSRVKVATTSKLGTEGDYVADMVTSNKAVLGINAGGFADANFNGDGGTPLGTTISEGDVITDAQYKNGNSGIIGFDNENNLVLEAYTPEEAVQNGIRDCISFGPFLMKDGERQKLTGVGALGPSSRAARTIIGQREDGIVLFLVVDGDRTKGEGATLGEVTDIMENYGAVNVANLDGGTSSQMVIGSTIINDPTSMNGEHRTRPVSTAFILAADQADNGDKTIVADKLK